MAHLKRTRIGPGTYLYIVQSVRRGDKVTQKVLEYLGRDPDPKRLAAALRYWKVGRKRGGANAPAKRRTSHGKTDR